VQQTLSLPNDVVDDGLEGPRRERPQGTSASERPPSTLTSRPYGRMSPRVQRNDDPEPAEGPAMLLRECGSRQSRHGARGRGPDVAACRHVSALGIGNDRGALVEPWTAHQGECQPSSRLLGRSSTRIREQLCVVYVFGSSDGHQRWPSDRWLASEFWRLAHECVVRRGGRDGGRKQKRPSPGRGSAQRRRSAMRS
jgi:hypothetical protein